MDALSTVLGEVFGSRADTSSLANSTLSIEDERALIAATRAGDSAALVALIRAYAPAMRRMTGQYRNAGGAAIGDAPDPHAVEGLRAAAVEGLMEAVHAFDPERHERLAAVIGGHLAIATAGGLGHPIAITVPQRTLTRFYSILREADGNVYEAAALAPAYGMQTDTFLAVLSAVRNVDSYDALVDAEGSARGGVSSPTWDGAFEDATARVLVEGAFASVDVDEAAVVRLGFGFDDYDPLPDAEVGARLGISRRKAQRHRVSAIDKMRVALGAA